MSRVKLRGRTILLYILVAVIPTIVIFLFYTRSYIKAMEEDAVNSVMQTLKQASLNISNKIDNVRLLSDSLFVNDNIRLSLRTDPTSQSLEQQMEEITEIRNAKDAAMKGSSLKSIRFYVNDGKIYANDNIDFYPISSFFSNPDFAGATSRGNWVTTYPYMYLQWRENTEILSFVRIIKDVKQLDNTIGAMVIDIEEQEMFAALKQIDFSWDYSVYVIDRSGTVISGPKTELFGTLREAGLPPDTETQASSIHSENSIFYLRQKIEGSDWTLVTEVPRASIRSSYLSTRANLILLMVFLILFVGGLLVVMAANVNGVSRRVQDLSQVLIGERSSINKTSGITKEKRGLYKSLDQSLADTKLLIQTLYQQMENQKKTQLQLLQAQINPHFLYNTLDTVQWMVRTGDKENAEETIRALTSYLRLILNNGKDEVTVEDEVNLADAYIAIQRKRFGDSFDADFIVEPQARGCTLPKLTLQPVIENALLHGILGMKLRRGRIDVDIYEENGVLCLSVTDNGVGMDAGTLQALLQASREGSDAFGLYNVNQRLILYSGDPDSGIQAESEPEKYTTITLKVKQPPK